jgi:hypothetical protein
MSVRFRIGAAAVGTLLAFGAAVLPAQAATADNGNLQKAQKTVTDGIDKRLTSLGDLQTRLAAFKDVSAGDRTTLSTLLSSDVTGLTALKAKVGGETTVEAVRADGKTMVDDYRVYLLVGPKVHLTHALAAETAADVRLTKIHDALADKLAKDSKADTDANEELLADMAAQIKAADARIDGKTSALLALKPGPDAKAITDATHDVLGAAKDARGDIGKAVADAKKVRDALKGSAKG